MRVCMWHGWLLQGSGSNVATARQVESLRAAGHDVVLLCQERHPERFGFVDAFGSVDSDGVSELTPTDADPAAGRLTLLRPDIGGEILPVFVEDRYEGFERAVRFPDLSDDELERYLASNAAALRSAVGWHGPEVVIAGHVVPGPVVALRALGPGRYSAKVHGSDLEYAVDVDPRYAELARPALEGALAVVGLSDDVLARAVAVAPAIADRVRKIPPGVDVERFRPRPRTAALEEAAALLEAEPLGAGRPPGTDERVRGALAERDGDALDRLGDSYDQFVPDPDAPARLRRLAEHNGPLIGFLGKLIAAKGVERMVSSVALAPRPARGLVIGFGRYREWHAALVAALDSGDADAYRWLREESGMRLELGDDEVRGARGLASRIDFTGILDHRFAPLALAGLDVLIVPSTLKEALALVAAEGAAAGALPLIARHSGLAEISAALEAEVGRPGLFSFEAGGDATHACAEGLARLLALPAEDRRELRAAVAGFVAREWSWDRSAARLLEACTPSAG